MQIEVLDQHRWLHRLLGKWTYSHNAQCMPDQPAQEMKGTDEVHSLGELWVRCHGQWNGPGGGADYSIMTLGYDPLKGKFVGTFIASMMTFLWVYEGELDPSGKKLVLTVEGPDFTQPGKLVTYQDIIEFIDDHHRTLTSQTRDADGNWQVFMNAHYHRVME